MNLKSLKIVLQGFDKFLISSHINPEGDSIGSQLALMSLLQRLGKEVVILNESPVPKVLHFLPNREKILKEIIEGFNFQTAIILDCPGIKRIGNITKYISEDKIIINIDHHISNENFGTHNWVDVNASSVGEMIFWLFKEFNVQIEYEEALAIYAAIMTDTGSFKYKNTSSMTHNIVGELMDIGVIPYDIYGSIYENSSIEGTRLLGESLQTLKVSSDGKIAWLWITKEMLKKTKASLEGTEDIINFGRAIGGVQVAILFRETGTDDRIKVSFRSKGSVDVNKLAGVFEGGGHTTASGCFVIGKKEEVEKRVLEKTEGMVI